MTEEATAGAKARYLRFRRGTAGYEGEHNGKPMDMYGATYNPPGTLTITLDQLIEAFHSIHHQYAHLWPPSPTCGCREAAEFMFGRMGGYPRQAGPAPCDDCYRTDGTHDPEVEH